MSLRPPLRCCLLDAESHVCVLAASFWLLCPPELSYRFVVLLCSRSTLPSVQHADPIHLISASASVLVRVCRLSLANAVRVRVRSRLCRPRVEGSPLRSQLGWVWVWCLSTLSGRVLGTCRGLDACVRLLDSANFDAGGREEVVCSSDMLLARLRISSILFEV